MSPLARGAPSAAATRLRQPEWSAARGRRDGLSVTADTPTWCDRLGEPEPDRIPPRDRRQQGASRTAPSASLGRHRACRGCGGSGPEILG